MLFAGVSAADGLEAKMFRDVVNTPVPSHIRYDEYCVTLYKLFAHKNKIIQSFPITKYA